jgi:hypothetical protein
MKLNTWDGFIPDHRACPINFLSDSIISRWDLNLCILFGTGKIMVMLYYNLLHSPYILLADTKQDTSITSICDASFFRCLLPLQTKYF